MGRQTGRETSVDGGGWSAPTSASAMIWFPRLAIAICKRSIASRIGRIEKLRSLRAVVKVARGLTERRVLAGEPVVAGEKLVSLFEPHADIIVKGSRNVDYGHKLNLTTGRSGSILDIVVEAGNPADSDRLLPMLERHIASMRLGFAHYVSSGQQQEIRSSQCPVLCASSGRKSHPDDLRVCELIGLPIHLEFATTGARSRLLPLVELLDGTKRNADER